MFFRNRIKNLSDEELISSYQSSEDPAYVGELFERYTHMSFLVCMKYLKDEVESEDAVMQVFEKLINDLSKYNIKSFRPWLHTVLRNHCLVLLDKQQRVRQKSDNYVRDTELFMELQSLDHLSNDIEMRELELEQLEKALGLLKIEQRRCLELFYLQQKRYQEVASITGYTMKQVKSFIQNGKRNLKKHLEKGTV